MSHLMTKPTMWLCSPVWSGSSLSAWRKLGSLATHWAHSEDSDQTGRIPRLICVFAGRTCHFVGFVTRRLIYIYYYFNQHNLLEHLYCSFCMFCCISKSLHLYEPAHDKTNEMTCAPSERQGWSESLLGALCHFVGFVMRFLIYGPGHAKTCLMSYANNKSADQPAHPRSLISAFVVRCLDSIII